MIVAFLAVLVMVVPHPDETLSTTPVGYGYWKHHLKEAVGLHRTDARLAISWQGERLENTKWLAIPKCCIRKYMCFRSRVP